MKNAVYPASIGGAASNVKEYSRSFKFVMRSCLSDFFFARDLRRTRTIIVMDESSVAPPRRFAVRPLRVLQVGGGALLGVALLTVLLLAFTPLRTLIPGYPDEATRRRVRANARRVQALEDSLSVQQQYVARVRLLMTGQVDSAQVAAGRVATQQNVVSGALAAVRTEPSSESWSDHEQPALSVVRLSPQAQPPFRTAAADLSLLAGLTFPVRPPVEGFVTRGFDARAGHYAIDIAVEEGTPVRSIGSGYVIMADWTQDGGGVIAVQHAGGFVSVYKHNQRLLKHVGDRVREREPIARSGNTGEITTGPHVHVELWHNGLAQDPARYFVGL